MHCRRVRSYLSAYSNDELTGTILRDVREHLSGCRECRSEEAIYRSMRLATRQLPARHLGVDFNSQILDRVAKERFAETRTQAYMPKASPSFVWRRLVPAVVSVCAIAIVAISLVNALGDKSPDGAQQIAGVNVGANDDYLRVHPLDNRTARLNPQWSLNNHLAQTDRMVRLTSSMTQTPEFDRRGALAGNQTELMFRDSRDPNTIYYYRVRPVGREVNQTVTNASYKESDKVY